MMINIINPQKIFKQFIISVSMLLIFVVITGIVIVGSTKVAEKTWIVSTSDYWDAQPENMRGHSDNQMYEMPNLDPNDFKNGYTLKVSMYEQIEDGSSVFIENYYWIVGPLKKS